MPTEPLASPAAEATMIPIGKARRIKAARITSIALCRRGVNGFRTMLKADGAFCLESLTKAAGENELLNVVYAPNREDGDGEFADARVIKAAAHEYNRDHRELDIEHDGKTLSNDEAYVAESFIVAKGDERFTGWKNYDGQPVGDLTGAWATVIKLESPALQKAYREGHLDGVSMFGQAALERVDTSAASKRVAERLGKSRDAQQEKDMELKELQDTLSGFKAEIVTMVKSAVAEATKPAAPVVKDEPKALDAPVFKGDATKAADLEAFAGELKAHEINKALADGKLTAAEIVELAKSMSAVAPSDEEAGVEKGDSPEVAGLKRQLFKAQKARNSPEGAPRAEDTSVEAIQKAASDEGKAIADLYNESRGSGRESGMRLVKS